MPVSNSNNRACDACPTVPHVPSRSASVVQRFQTQWGTVVVAFLFLQMDIVLGSRLTTFAVATKAHGIMVVPVCGM